MPVLPFTAKLNIDSGSTFFLSLSLFLTNLSSIKSILTYKNISSKGKLK